MPKVAQSLRHAVPVQALVRHGGSRLATCSAPSISRSSSAASSGANARSASLVCVRSRRRVDLPAVARMAIGDELVHRAQWNGWHNPQLLVQAQERPAREPVNAAVNEIGPSMPRGADAAKRQVVFDDRDVEAADACITTR